MTLDEYQEAALRTANRALDTKHRLLDAAAGLSEEAGEVLGHVRKHVMQQRALDTEALTLELGDALWCLAVAADAAGIRLSDVARANQDKLHARHPQGFDSRAPIA